MSEWWTYRLTSFLLFSPSTYYRMLERYNLAIWPAQLAGVAIGLAIVVLLIGKRAHHERIIAGLLAACWMWIALAFHYQRYAQINWAATWFALAFACEALLLVVVGVLAGRLDLQLARSGTLWIASSILAMSILGYPVLAPLTGRPWTTAEIFGVAADPTAIASVAVLARVRGRIRWLLLIVPALWCAIAAAMLWAMDAPEALVVLAAGLLALWPAVARRRRDATDAMR
jgi:hypothetical protein